MSGINVSCKPSEDEKVICLSGSMRFKDLKEKVFKELLKNGWYVRGSECVADESTFADGYRDYLRYIHMKKIFESDALYVVNKDGYIGKDTEDEIIFARNNDISVYFFEEDIDGEIDKDFNNISKEDIKEKEVERRTVSKNCPKCGKKMWTGLASPNPNCRIEVYFCDNCGYEGKEVNKDE